MEERVFLQWMAKGQLSIPKLLIRNYKEIGLTEIELVAILQIQTFIEQGESFPTPDRLSQHMTLTESECADLLGRLVRLQYVTLEKRTDEQGIVYEFLTLEPLWIKLLQRLKNEEHHEKEQNKRQEEGQLFQRFEEEFSRPLSPIEAETLSMWIDQDNHSPALITAALREAVISSKLNFRYIDRILFEWKRNGIQTVDQARVHGEKFRKHNQSKREPQRNIPKDLHPGFDWLKQSK